MSFPDLDSIVSFAKALGSIATFAISVLSFVIAVRIWRRQEENDHRASAELVNAWMVSGEVDDQGNYHPTKRNLIIIQNGGSTPIYRVSVETIAEGRTWIAPAKREWLVLPPGTFRCELEKLANGSRRWSLPRHVGVDELRGYSLWVLDPNHVIKATRFTDASGFAWTRDERGLLTDASQPTETAGQRTRRSRGTSTPTGGTAESAA